jgi:hypothetical protein
MILNYLKSKIFISNFLASLFITLLAVGSRLPFIEKFQSHMDGPQYSIAIIRYSFDQQTPAPPGYPLYIGLAKLLNVFLNDPYKAILGISVLGTITGSISLYFILKKMYGKKAGISALILFFTGSTFYYFGLTTWAFLLILTVTALLAFVVYQIFLKRKKYGILLGLLAAIEIGIRPQEIFQILPLLLLGFTFLDNREKIKSILVGLLITLLWLLPVVYLVGGPYIFLRDIHNSSSFLTQFSPIKNNLEMIIKGFFLSFGISSFFFIFYIFKSLINDDYKKSIKILIFYFVWILPGLFFNLFFRSDQVGYQMVYLTGFIFLISFSVSKILNNNLRMFIIMLGCISIFNLYLFFYNRDPYSLKPYYPLSYHYTEIKKNDIQLGSKVSFILKSFKAKETMIITTPAYWRQYMYYLKDYQLIDLAAMDTILPNFMYVRRDAKNWNMREYKSKKFQIEIPDQVTKIIFTDDNSNNWFHECSCNVYSFPENSRLTIATVKKGSILKYKYHYFSIISNN